MTKNKHPQSRAERLKIKKLKFNETKKEFSGKVRRKIKEQIKEQETRNELHNYDLQDKSGELSLGQLVDVADYYS